MFIGTIDLVCCDRGTPYVLVIRDSDGAPSYISETPHGNISLSVAHLPQVAKDFFTILSFQSCAIK